MEGFTAKISGNNWEKEATPVNQQLVDFIRTKKAEVLETRSTECNVQYDPEYQDKLLKELINTPTEFTFHYKRLTFLLPLGKRMVVEDCPPIRFRGHLKSVEFVDNKVDIADVSFILDEDPRCE